MKKFKVTWGYGMGHKQKEILKSKTMTAKDISKVKFLTILPKDIRKKVVLVQVTLHSDKVRIIDYGSHSKFIVIKEI